MTTLDTEIQITEQDLQAVLQQKITQVTKLEIQNACMRRNIIELNLRITELEDPFPQEPDDA
jgi:hypothetical protein